VRSVCLPVKENLQLFMIIIALEVAMKSLISFFKFCLNLNVFEL
jgi:hypothetical protein